jgi:hypothetical protein
VNHTEQIHCIQTIHTIPFRSSLGIAPDKET